MCVCSEHKWLVYFESECEMEREINQQMTCGRKRRFNGEYYRTLQHSDIKSLESNIANSVSQQRKKTPAFFSWNKSVTNSTPFYLHVMSNLQWCKPKKYRHRKVNHWSQSYQQSKSYRISKDNFVLSTRRESRRMSWSSLMIFTHGAIQATFW